MTLGSHEGLVRTIASHEGQHLIEERVTLIADVIHAFPRHEITIENGSRILGV
jgi:hypothetical protein